MFKVDLHTHSIISHDGGIDEEGYKKLLDTGILDFVAVTDHNEISFAQKLAKSLGNRVIVGEEISTGEGEIIGLFLSKQVQKGLGAKETALAIKKQKGLVYIPHPYESLRDGISAETLAEIVGLIDIIEVFNGRTLQPGTSKKALAAAQKHKLATASSSDAHGYRAVGGAYSILSKAPRQRDLVTLLQIAQFRKEAASVLSRLTPKFNKLKKLYE